MAQSHIEENAPAKSEFEKILKRDLESYFKRATRKAVTVQHEFLRDGPTQSGVSYPKYYLWVKIYDRKRLIDEGAVRAAAMEQKQFEITDYLSRNAMRNGPEQIDTVFPQPVGDRIRGCIK